MPWVISFKMGVEPLIEVIETEKNAMIRTATVKAFGRLGDKKAMKALQEEAQFSGEAATEPQKAIKRLKRLNDRIGH